MSKPVDVPRRDPRKVPFSGQQPDHMRKDLVVADPLTNDERFWVPLDDGVWSRPLHFDVTHGQYTHVMRVTREGVVARHRHTGTVFALVVKGRWHYLEHEWIASEGTFAFEPPGETHTLIVPEGAGEMVTIFQVTGALIYVTPDGEPIGYDDVFTRLEKARLHFDSVGLGQEVLMELVR